MALKERLDHALVARGFFPTRARAQAAIEVGLVTVDGEPARKASQMVEASAGLTAEAPHPYVSRGGVKLAKALDHFNIDPTGLHCLDIGASTGGFSDCLLRRGAAFVTAVDVGTAQLHAALKGHPRLASFEQKDIRAFAPEQFVQAPALVVIDVSFISLKEILPAATALAAQTALMVVLVKPQFELARSSLKKGIVRDEVLRKAALDKACEAAQAIGWRLLGSTLSPITGGDGNVEFLVALQRG
jgi:23S rRNA (cytidine1920-2'-O)/16S rRNA (cytidine1409-2'-O)-methyltransferase